MYTLYGVHGCGMCAALEQRMKVKKIPYQKIEDMDVIKSLDLDSVPALDTGKNILYFPEAIKFLSATKPVAANRACMSCA